MCPENHQQSECLEGTLAAHPVLPVNNDTMNTWKTLFGNIDMAQNIVGKIQPYKKIQSDAKGGQDAHNGSTIVGEYQQLYKCFYVGGVSMLCALKPGYYQVSCIPSIMLATDCSSLHRKLTSLLGLLPILNPT